MCQVATLAGVWQVAAAEKREAAVMVVRMAASRGKAVLVGVAATTGTAALPGAAMAAANTQRVHRSSDTSYHPSGAGSRTQRSERRGKTRKTGRQTRQRFVLCRKDEHPTWRPQRPTTGQARSRTCLAMPHTQWSRRG